MERSILGFLLEGSFKFLELLNFRFSLASTGAGSSFGGLRTAKIKFFEFFGPDPALTAPVPFVISANFSSVEESRVKNEPRLFPVCCKEEKRIIFFLVTN
jgi:hypothetical protein